MLLCAVQEEGTIQANWASHLHAKYFSSTTGSLAPLRLSSSLQHSLWAISLVRSRTFSGGWAAGKQMLVQLRCAGWPPTPKACCVPLDTHAVSRAVLHLSRQTALTPTMSSTRLAVAAEPLSRTGSAWPKLRMRAVLLDMAA